MSLTLFSGSRSQNGRTHMILFSIIFVSPPTETQNDVSSRNIARPFRLLIDDAFSIEIGLELSGIAGPVR